MPNKTVAATATAAATLKSLAEAKLCELSDLCASVVNLADSSLQRLTP